MPGVHRPLPACGLLIQNLAYAKREKGKKAVHPENIDYFSRLEKGNLLLTYEGYRIGEFDEPLLNKPVLDRFGNPADTKNIFVIRNLFNMLPSNYQLRMRSMEAKGKNYKWVIKLMDRKLEVWKSYALLSLLPSSTRGEFIAINFDKWIFDQHYRDELALAIGYINQDKYVDLVSDAGGGSSFQTSSSNLKVDVLKRWECANKDLMKNHKEVVDLAALIFGKDSMPGEYLV